MWARALGIVGVALAAFAGAPVARAADLVVAPGTAIQTLTAAIARAKPGDRIIVQAGRYAEPPIVIDVPRVTVEGRGWPEFSGSGEHAVVIVAAEGVTVRGIVATNTGYSDLDDRAGILVRDTRDCLVEGNRLRDVTFGIYLRRSTG